MIPDVLFWFYKDFDTCQKRLQRLRRLNQDIHIFALYGGDPDDADTAQNAIQEWVDDFYVYPYEKDPKWKWKHGDQMMATWYIERGRHLQWDTIFIMQWDMLIYDPLERLFCTLQSNEILLSGFRSIHKISSWWPWADSKDPDLSSFKDWLHRQFNYDGELFACLFIVVCLPRIFLDKYVEVGHPEAGFLEYKIPTLAHIFDIPVCHQHGFEPWWAADPATRNAPGHQRTLNAVGQEIPLSVILRELTKDNGKRIFHPVFRTIPAWMENPISARILCYSYLLPMMEISLRSVKKLKQYAKKLTRS